MWICQKSHVALIFLMFGKNYPNYRKLAKTKKQLSQTLKLVSNVTKYFFLPKKKDAFLKKIAIFFLKKGNLWRKILFYFFESSNSYFWENSPWNKLVRFWVGWIILFYFISNLMTSAKNIINFQFTIYMCIPLFLCLVRINRPWRDGWMTGQMWSIISSICLIITRLWHVCHLFLLFFLLCHIYIPIFLCPVGVNRPWRDRWMTRRMDEMMLHDVLYYV